METSTLLPTNKSRDFLKDIDGWHITEDHKIVFKDFILHDFMNVITVINDIAAIAQDENHHPDVHLTQYKNLRVCLTSHDAGGLTEKDFTVASRINHLDFDPKRQGETVKTANKTAAKTTKKTTNKAANKMTKTKKAPKSSKTVKAKKPVNRVTQRKNR